MKTQPPIRKSDSYGSGHYGASRGNRLHRGIDYACYPETKVLSLTDGHISKLGYPYGDDLKFRYVQVTDPDGNDLRYFYVSPCVQLGIEIKSGEPLGFTQKLGARYKGITEHFHFEIKKDGSYLNPKEYLEGIE